ncbi:MFS transporter [Lichenihabitans sp. Uapishka_5]|uniref:MFS transporter n=1 Tax=Lichenihabitans sp. Uapishka_5 TaxID=3037302 RepID=UPI00301A7384
MTRPLTSPMPRRRLDALREVGAMPMFTALLTTLLLIGLRDAMTAPYLVLLAIEHAHLPPVLLGLFLTARAAGAIAFGILFGAWFDRAPTLRPLAVSLAAGVVGYAMLAPTTGFVPLLLIGAVPLGISSAAFPLLFALAKLHLGAGDRLKAERGTAILRASFSAAWGVGPAVGAIAVARSADRVPGVAGP